MKPKNFLKENKLHIVCLFLSAIALLTKVESFSGFPGSLLWAEDGNIFIPQAHQFGFSSIFKTYAGYYHFYPRIFALLSLFFPLALTPWIFVSGWLFAWFLMVLAIVRVARIVGAQDFYVVFLVIVATFQPTALETILNLTNAQWPIAVFLTLHVVFEIRCFKNELADFFVALAFALSGPWIIFLVPIIAAKFALNRRNNKKTEIIPVFYAVLIASVIQGLAIYSFGGRPGPSLLSSMTSNGFDLDFFMLFIGSLLQIWLFNGAHVSYLLLGAILWGAIFYFFLKGMKNTQAEDNHRILLLLVASMTFLVASLLFSTPVTAGQFKIGNAGRYVFVPVILNIILFFLVTFKYRWANICIMTMTLFAMLSLFNQPSYLFEKSLPFRSYEKFSRIREVYIPVSPGGGWGFDARFNFRGQLAAPDKVMIFKKHHNEKETNVNPNLFWNGAHLRLPIPETCGCATDLGIEIDVERSSAGDVLLQWFHEGKTHYKGNSIQRSSGAGMTTVQFAFPLEGNHTHIDFNPMSNEGDVIVHEVRFYCLK